jgi:hypothetical protein
MAFSTSNVNTVTDTFQTWVDKTNVLLDAYSTTIVTAAANSEGGVTTGNATIQGIFTANSISINGTVTEGLRGGNTTVSNTLFVTSNVSIGNSTVNTVITSTSINTDLSLIVLGNTALSNTLSVVGNTTMTNILVTGEFQLVGNLNIANGTLFADASTNRVGINNTAPGVALRVTGAADISSTANIQGNANVGGTLGVFGNTTLSGGVQLIGGNSNFDSGTLFVDATNNRVGINNTAPGVALRVTGAVDISSTANIQGNANVGGTLGVLGDTTLSGNTSLLGNATLSGTLQTISGNVIFDTNVLVVDATNNRVGILTTTPGVALDVVGSANVSTSVNSALLSVGTNFIANSSAIVGTGFANISTSVNSALLTVGTDFIANTTGVYHTGLVNAASFVTSGIVANTTALVPTSNTILLGNSTSRFVISANTGNFSGSVSGITTLASGNTTITGFANISTSVNSALLTVGTNFIANTTGVYHTGLVNAASHTVGSNFIANTTGVYHTGLVNAASFTTGGIVANTIALVPTSNTILLGNSTSRFVISANTGNFSGDVTLSANTTGNNLAVSGNLSINSFATFLTFANTDLGSNTTHSITAISFPKADYHTGELLLHVKRGTEYQITKMLFTHDDTNISHTVYGSLVSPSASLELANNILLSINASNIDLTLIQRSANSTVKILANMIN